MPWYDSDEEIQKVNETNFVLWMFGLMAVIFFIFYQFDLFSMGMGLALVVPMKAIVIRSNWKLRKHNWFWLSFVLLLPLEILLLYKYLPDDFDHWNRGLFTCIAIPDFLLNFAVIFVSKKLFLSDRDDEDDNDDTEKNE